MANVCLRRLGRHYPGAQTPALTALDLAIQSGEFVVLVGPSGCGKSTALRLIAGLDTPDHGQILIDDREMSAVPPQERDVAMVFQGYALYPHLSVRDNLAFPLKMRRVPRAERARRVSEAATLLGLGKLLDRLPSELSGGERQRVAMGRAIVRSPKVFLFDEPLANLDAALRAELRVELSALVRKLGTTSLYVTHDQIEAMTMGDRVAVLCAGKLMQVGPPRTIYQDPDSDFVASFLGSPSINWIAMEREGASLRGAGVLFPVPRGITLSERVKAAVRPEHLTFRETDARGPTIPLEAVVLTVELLGAETHVLLEAPATRLWVRTQGLDAPARGERLRAYVPTEALLWFDAATGARLRALP